MMPSSIRPSSVSWRRRWSQRAWGRSCCCGPAAPSSATGELDRLVADDVLLHLGGAGADRRVALEDVEPVPGAALDGVGPALGQHGGGAEEVAGQLGERLGEVAPLELGQGYLRPVLLAVEDLRERPVVEEPGVL